jgi:hypothetical protein
MPTASSRRTSSEAVSTDNKEAARGGKTGRPSPPRYLSATLLVVHVVCYFLHGRRRCWALRRYADELSSVVVDMLHDPPSHLLHGSSPRGHNKRWWWLVRSRCSTKGVFVVRHFVPTERERSKEYACEVKKSEIEILFFGYLKIVENGQNLCTFIHADTKIKNSIFKS